MTMPRRWGRRAAAAGLAGAVVALGPGCGRPGPPAVEVKVDAADPAAGPRAVLSLPRTEFRAGEAVVPTFALDNPTGRPLTVYRCGFYPNHRLVVRDAAGKAAAETALGRACRQAFDPAGPRRKNVPVDLPPGGRDAEPCPHSLTELYDLSKPGRYTVEGVYEEGSLPWVGRAAAAPVAFAVTPAGG